MNNIVRERDVIAMLSKIALSTEEREEVTKVLIEYITNQVAHEVDQVINLTHSPRSGVDYKPAETLASSQMVNKKRQRK